MEAQDQKLRGRLKIWQRAAVLALWIFVPIFLGVVRASFNGEHGSVVFVLVGFYVGIAGAISYLLFELIPQFRRLGSVWRLTISTVAAAMPTVIFLIYDSFAPHTYPITPGARASYLALMSGTATAFAFIAAIIITGIASGWSNQDSA